MQHDTINSPCATRTICAAYSRSLACTAACKLQSVHAPNYHTAHHASPIACCACCGSDGLQGFQLVTFACEKVLCCRFKSLTVDPSGGSYTIVLHACSHAMCRPPRPTQCVACCSDEGSNEYDAWERHRLDLEKRKPRRPKSRRRPSLFAPLGRALVKVRRILHGCR